MPLYQKIGGILFHHCPPVRLSVSASVHPSVHLHKLNILVPRSSAKVKVKYQGHVSQKMSVSRALVFHKHILFFQNDFYPFRVRNQLLAVFCLSSAKINALKLEVSQM